MSILVVRQFVRLRAMLAANGDVARKLDELEKRYDRQFAVVFDAIRQVVGPPDGQPGRPPKKPIGYQTEGERSAAGPGPKDPAQAGRAGPASTGGQ